MTTKRPVVTKIEFTKEQLEDIDALRNNRPTKAQIERHSKLKRASDTETWIRTRGHVPRKYIHDILKKQFYKGLCHICQDWPVYKVIQDRDGATLKELYCEKHLPKAYSYILER